MLKNPFGIHNGEINNSKEEIFKKLKCPNRWHWLENKKRNVLILLMKKLKIEMKLSVIKQKNSSWRCDYHRNCFGT